MNLTLEIVSSNGASLGPARRKVFGPEGGRIGRSPECDWVLPNPYISRHHATIRWISGTYYIESTGENGVAIGTPQAIVPKLERRALKHGDHIFIDEYEAVVGLDSVVAEVPSPAPGAGIGAFAPADDPFADPGPTRSSRALVEPFEPAQEELDPLKHLGGRGASPVVTAPRQESGWNHTPGVSDHFAPPPAAPVAPVIPDDWDKTSFGRAKPTPAGAPGQMPAAPGPVHGAPAIPDDWDKTSFSQKPAVPPAAARPGSMPAPAPASGPGLRPGPAAGVAPTPRPAISGAGPAGAAQSSAAQGTRLMGRPAAAQPISPDTAAAQPASRTASPRNPAVPAFAAQTPPPQTPGALSPAAPTPSPSPAPTPTPQWPLPSPQPAPVVRPEGPQPGGFDVAAFLMSAGLDPASIPPETAGALGQVLRSVVQGVIDVLRARAEIKEQFRLSQTIVKTAENNPLKFAVNAEDALGSLLGRRNPAYLPPVEAFEDAFDDIRFHQLAMLAGMRAGFDHVLSRFDPQQLQENFDKRARRGGLLSMSAKSRYWEQFTEEFQELAGDRERAFRRLFAEEFAAAYEKQLELLKRSHGKLRR